MIRRELRFSLYARHADGRVEWAVWRWGDDAMVGTVMRVLPSGEPCPFVWRRRRHAGETSANTFRTRREAAEALVDHALSPAGGLRDWTPT